MSDEANNVPCTYPLRTIAILAGGGGFGKTPGRKIGPENRFLDGGGRFCKPRTEKVEDVSREKETVRKKLIYPSTGYRAENDTVIVKISKKGECSIFVARSA